NFTGFIIAEIVIALGVTLTSGAFKAWLVDSLNYYKWNGNLLSVFRLNGRMTKSAQLMGGLIGAYLGATNLSIPFIVTGVGFLIVAIIAHLIMKEEYFDYHSDKKPRAWLNIKKIALDSINYGLKHHVVFLVITVSMVLEFGFMALNMYWQPWFRPSLPGNEYLGYIWAGIVIFAMIGNEIVNWFEKKMPDIKIGYLVIGFSAGLMIIASAIPIFMLSLTAFYLHEIARGLFEPYTDAKLQENIPAKNRATINSFVSMTRKGAAGLGLIVFGLITNSYGISLGWILSGLTIIILLPMAMLINGRHKKAF
ncbi:MFS transporter, partial [Patescibacteria group bacterium]|nr:MFS transporter [Patescibacteria group bacterium]